MVLCGNSVTGSIEGTGRMRGHLVEAVRHSSALHRVGIERVRTADSLFVFWTKQSKNQILDAKTIESAQ